MNKCCICGKEFHGYGNNPDGAAWLNNDGNMIMGTFKVGEVCCNVCNKKFVVPGRIIRFYHYEPTVVHKYLSLMS